MTMMQQPPTRDFSAAPRARAVSLWLFICAFSVFAMALIGAITRLTESGLSITEWKPVTGALPPLNAADWQREYDLYQQSPQGQLVNAGMSMEDFKYIFFWEWFHRLWGRVIGLLYALPLLYFWRHLPKGSRGAFLGVLGLGFLQGAMGWYMVKSGLLDAPAVSHYRLAAHLMLAFLIFGCLWRLALAFRLPRQEGALAGASLRGFARACIALAALVMTWGAFVAGLDAGMVYNTFPKMDAHWFPPEALQHNPVWLAFFEEPASVQFVHRVLAVLLVVKVLILWNKARRLALPSRLARLYNAAAMMVAAQAGLGIATLVTQVDIHLAVLHQGGALVLLSLLLWILHETPKAERP